MYFPYLRGRQFELIALRELIENDLIGKKVIPVLEPIKPTSTLAKTLAICSEKKHLHALVVNPAVGEFVSKIKELRRQDSDLDYLPSQYIANYIKSLGYDGICYRSTLYKKGVNYAIFDSKKFECIKVDLVHIDSVKYEITAKN